MKILILGASGQLGTDLLRLGHSRSNRFEMIPLDRNQLNLMEIPSIHSKLSALSFDVLVNCAAYNKVDEAEKNPMEAYLVNGHAVKPIAEVCADKKSRLVHVSTDFVFDGHLQRPYIETDVPAPLSVYGASKLIGEMLALSTHEDTLVLRTASLFGVSSSRGKGENFVESMIRLGREKGRIQVVQDIRMSPTSAADLAKMILTLIEREGEPGIYHAVNSGEASWCEFAQEIISMSDTPADVIPTTQEKFPSVAKRPSYSVLNSGKISAMVREIPHWKEALKNYLAEKGYLS